MGICREGRASKRRTSETVIGMIRVLFIDP